MNLNSENIHFHPYPYRSMYVIPSILFRILVLDMEVGINFVQAFSLIQDISKFTCHMGGKRGDSHKTNGVIVIPLIQSLWHVNFTCTSFPCSFLLNAFLVMLSEVCYGWVSAWVWLRLLHCTNLYFFQPRSESCRGWLHWWWSSDMYSQSRWWVPRVLPIELISCLILMSADGDEATITGVVTSQALAIDPSLQYQLRADTGQGTKGPCQRTLNYPGFGLQCMHSRSIAS